MNAPMKPARSFIRLIVCLIFSYGGQWALAQTNFWQQTNGPFESRILSLAINASGHIFAGTRPYFARSGSGVFRSTNNGASWIAVNTGLTNLDVRSLAINSATGDIFAGTDGDGVFHSSNNGDDWTAVNTGLTDLSVRSLAINASGYIFAGTLGGGVFRSVQSTTAVEEIAAERPASFELAQNYPSPFNPGTRIKFYVPATSLVRLEVFNIMGQHIATLLEEKRAAGEHELGWDGRNDFGQPVPSGVYLLSISVGEFTQTRKMVLAR